MLSMQESKSMQETQTKRQASFMVRIRCRVRRSGVILTVRGGGKIDMTAADQRIDCQALPVAGDAEVLGTRLVIIYHQIHGCLSSSLRASFRQMPTHSKSSKHSQQL
jgi:hypothetical protein